MFRDFRRNWRARKVKPGDGHALQRFRWWQPFSRVLFSIDLRSDTGVTETWTVDVRIWGDNDDGEQRARLYRDGANVALSKLPASFTVPGGEIEVAASMYGLKRCHFVSSAGSVVQLTPDPASAEGRRGRFDRSHPIASRLVGVVSVLVLIVAGVLGLPQIVEQITAIPPIAENIGTFVSPIQLPVWLNITLLIAGIVASTERALRLRYNWLLDGGGDFEVE